MHILIFTLGWLLYAIAQAQNSLQSTTNGLEGWKGLRAWLRAHAVNLATRAFFSAIAYGFILNTVTEKLQAVGLPVTATMIAGIGGYSANTLLYQFFGFIPWLRVEVADLAPPSPPPAAAPGA